MIERYHELIREKDLEITGIDINRSYLNHCSSLIRSWNLERNIKIFHTPVEHYRPPEDRYFDFILFSMSFMLFADQGLVLDRVKGWVKPGGNITLLPDHVQEQISADRAHQAQAQVSHHHRLRQSHL
ncbi:MAG: class I SAM-dependent methyltransferase [Desulfomonilia bacterium]